MKQEIVKAPETLKDVQETDLVRLSRDLLGAMIKSTDIMNIKRMDKDGMKAAHVVLGYLNATTKAANLKMSLYKMMETKAKVQAVKKAVKRSWFSR